MTRGECYTIFGITKSISKDELKRRYRILIKKYHPDLNLNISKSKRIKNEEFCKKINTAYKILLKDEGIYYSSEDKPPFYIYHKNKSFKDIFNKITFKNICIAICIAYLLLCLLESILSFGILRIIGIMMVYYIIRSFIKKG